MAIDAADDGNRIEMDVRSGTGGTDVHLVAREADGLAPGSVFANLDAVSAFFESAPVGWTRRPDGTLDGVELRTKTWQTRPLEVEHIAVAYLDDDNRFPAGSIEFDSALVMRNVSHEWHEASRAGIAA